jgi:Methyltransferase domain
MGWQPARAGSEWLALREPVDADARAVELVDLLLPSIRPAAAAGARQGLEIHDLGAGTGSMTRWLADRLPSPQRWVLHDRDADLLVRAREAGSVSGVAIETRPGDVTRLPAAELASADLVTGSALLDMLTSQELDRLVQTCVRARCPVLLTLSVVGRVDLAPRERDDEVFMTAFNAHQRRATAHGPLLGPDASRVAAQAFAGLGLEVTVRSSPWRLGAAQTGLATAWLAGWVAAAVAQSPSLSGRARAYLHRRTAQLAQGALSITVQHQDLLALPRT